MSERLWQQVEEAGFWLTFTFDFLLLWSLIFSLFYISALALSSLPPLSSRLSPRAWSLPALAVLSLAATFSAPGELMAQALRTRLLPLLISIGQEQLPLILAGIWLSGTGLTLIRLVLKGLKLNRILAGFQPAADDRALTEALKIMGFQQPVSLRQAAPGFPAASWGLFRKLIVVPADFSGRYDYRERLGIYLHELTHIRNRDSLKLIMMSMLGRLLWFNPLVNKSVERYRCHLEIVCDRQAAALGRFSSLEYAKLITKHAGGPGGLLTGFSGDYRSVARRFSYIFNDRALRPVRRDRLAAGTCLAALLLGFLWSPQPDLMETRAEFEKMVETQPLPVGKLKVIFFRQGLLGTYSQVIIDD